MNPIDAIVALVLLVGLLQNQVPAITAGALAIVSLRGLTSRVTQWLKFGKIEWAIVISLSYWLANYFWSTHDLQNLVSYNFLRQDGAFLVSYTAFLFLLGWPLKARHCRAFWMALLTMLSLVAVAGIILSLNLPHPLFLERVGVVSFEPAVGANMFFGWYEAHNTAGGVYAIASVLGITLLQEEGLGPNTKLYRWSLLACCLGGLAFTFSRGAYLAFVAGAAFVLPIRKFGKLIQIALVVVVPAVLLVLATSSLMDRIDTITDPNYGTNAVRLDIWSEAWEDFELSPIVGIGFGRFNDERVEFKGIKHFVWVGVNGFIVNNDGHAHNSYLHFMAEGGIIGLLVMMSIWYFSWKELSFLERHLPRSSLRWLLRAGRACLVAVLVQSLTEHILGRGSVIIVLMALIGTTVASTRLELRALKRQSKGIDQGPAAPLPRAGVVPVPALGR